MIVARTPAETGFVGDAAAFLVAQNLTPITFDELNELIEVEKQRDLLGCSDVACYSEIAGAFGSPFVLLVRANERGTRALLSLYEQGPVVKKVGERIVSHESATELLLADVEDFRSEHRSILQKVSNIPCGFPWEKLFAVLGQPERIDGFGSSRPSSETFKAHYVNVKISVYDGRVRFIQNEATGSFLTACGSESSSP